MRKMTLVFMVILPALAMFSTVKAEELELSIYEIQHDADANGVSIYDSCDVNCIGGIVIHKFPGSKPKVTLYDPAYPDGWGGIAIKDFTDNKDFYYANDVNVGVWVSLTHTTVEEFNGNTQLKFESKSGFNPESTGNALPEPILVSPNDIAAPVFNPGPPWSWRVTDRRAEKYEAMLVRVENVIVTEKNLGWDGDNYSLEIYDNAGPNDICWAADYMNEEVEMDEYHRFVDLGSRFCSVTGIIEQYKQYDSYAEIDWDYYQLLTTRTGDLKRYTPADLDGDCMVDFSDFAVFCQYWLWGTE